MRFLFLFLAVLVGSVAVGQGDYKHNINFKRQMRADTATLQLVLLPNLSLPTAMALPLLRDTLTGRVYSDSCAYWRKCETLPFWATSGNNGTDSTSNFVGTTDGRPLVIKTNGVERMRVTSTGNVGLGTAFPSCKLDVKGGFKTEQWLNSVRYKIESGSNPGGIEIYAIDSMFPNLFNDNTIRTSESGIYLMTAIQGTYTSGISYEQNKEGLSIYSTNIISGNALSFFIDTFSNVGIGTSSLTAKLQVNGDVRIEGTDSVTIYAKTPPNGTFEYCTNCSGNGITGRLLGYIASAWRRFTIE